MEYKGKPVESQKTSKYVTCEQLLLLTSESSNDKLHVKQKALRTTVEQVNIEYRTDGRHLGQNWNIFNTITI